MEGQNLASGFHFFFFFLFFTPILISALHDLLLPPCDIITCSKIAAQNRAYFGIRNLYTHTVIAMNIGCHFFVCTALGIEKWLHNDYLKLPHLLAKFCTKYLHDIGRNSRQHSKLTAIIVTSYLQYSKCDGKLHKILILTLGELCTCKFP